MICRIHTGEKPFKCDRVDHECSKAFSTPHSLKSHLKTHEKKGQDRSKSSLTDDKRKPRKELNFIASADIYPSNGSSSEDSMIFENNVLQFQIIDDNGNNIKYSSPFINYVTSPTADPTSMLIGQNTNEALELSLAGEVEVGAPWVDISVLANKSVIPSTPLTSSCVALSTTIPTYVNLPTFHSQNDVMRNYFNTDPTDQTMKDLDDLLLTNDFDSEGKTLKSITADAGICQCSNCKCDPMQENGCVGGCGPHKPCRVPVDTGSDKPEQIEIDTKTLIEEIDSLNVDTTKPQAPVSSCDCKNTKEAVDKGCCVVICLKTLETVNADKEHGCGDRANGMTIESSTNNYQNMSDFAI